MSNLPAFKLVVPADFQYVDRTLATASWYDVYTIKAGEYPVTFTDIQGHPARTVSEAYYAKWDASAILTEEYRVNRLFTASSAHTSTPNTETTVRGRMYSYEVLNPREASITAYTTFGNADNAYKRTTNATIVPA